MYNTARFAHVEDAINRMKRADPVAPVMEKREIDERLRQRTVGYTPADYVLRQLPLRGFRTKDGEADWVRFYKYARIEPGVWSTFSSGLHAPSKETLLKIVVALRLNEREAGDLLAAAGHSLHDFRDQVILACMDCGYYEIEDVYDILEEYGGQIINGRRRFKNIYKEY